MVDERVLQVGDIVALATDLTRHMIVMWVATDEREVDADKADVLWLTDNGEPQRATVPIVALRFVPRADNA